MSRWDAFTRGTFDAAGDFDDGQLAAEDIILGRISQLFRADDLVLRAIDGDEDKIEIMEFRNPWDDRRGKRIQIFLSSTEDEDLPTQTDRSAIAVTIGVRYDVPSVEVLREFHPSVASLIRRLKAILKNEKTLKVQVNGKEIPIVHESRPGSVSWQSALSEAGDRLMATIEFDWLFLADVEHGPSSSLNNVTLDDIGRLKCISRA